MNTKFFTAVVLLFSIITGAYAQPQSLGWYLKLIKADPAEGAHLTERFQNVAGSSNVAAAERAIALKSLGLIKIGTNVDYDSSINYILEAERIEDSLGLKSEKVFSLLARAELLRHVFDFPSAKDLLKEAYRLNGDSQPEISAYVATKLAEVQISEGNYDEALESLQHAMSFSKGELSSSIAVSAEALVASVFQLQGRYEEARTQIRQALKQARRLQLQEEESHILFKAGGLYRAMKMPDRALENFNVALGLRMAAKKPAQVAECYNSIGELFFELGKTDSSIVNLHKGLAAARDANDALQIQKSFDLLAMAYKELGDVGKSLQYREEYTNSLEFTMRDRNEQMVVTNEKRGIITRKDSQIDTLSREKFDLSESVKLAKERLEKQREEMTYLIAFVALTVIILLLTLFLYLSKRKSNKQLKLVNQRINEQNLELQELNATKDKFFSIISHDLKGPLNSLTSFSGLLIHHTDSLTKEEIQVLAKDLDKSLKNLFALLENLLEWSRSQTGSIEFKAETFDFAELMKINQQLLSGQASLKKITIINEATRRINVSAHKHSINTVLRNLMANAIKFTGEGGAVTIFATDQGEYYKVSVRDTGVGMSPELMDKLFRIDTKVTTKGTADEKGTGLGLILCKDFVEKNGGKIWVESVAGKGSIFHFTVKKATEIAAAFPLEK